MDHVAMDAHLSKPCGHSYRLVGDHPGLADRPALHLHRKAHRWIDGTHAMGFECGHNPVRHRVDVLAGVMEFHIRYRARRTADGRVVHAANKADERLRGRKEAQDIGALLGDLRLLDGNETDIIGSRISTELTQPWRFYLRRRLRARRCGGVKVPDSWMFV